MPPHCIKTTYKKRTVIKFNINKQKKNNNNNP